MCVVCNPQSKLDLVFSYYLCSMWGLTQIIINIQLSLFFAFFFLFFFSSVGELKCVLLILLISIESK